MDLNIVDGDNFNGFEQSQTTTATIQDELDLGDDNKVDLQNVKDNSEIVENELFLSLKFYIDSQNKLNQLNQSRIRSFARFRKYCQTVTSSSRCSSSEQTKFDREQFQNEYNRFDQNYRYFRKRIRKLRKETKLSLSTRYQNPYDTLYELFAKIESLEKSLEAINAKKSEEEQFSSGGQTLPKISINAVKPSASTNGVNETEPKTRSRGRTKAAKKKSTISRRPKAKRVQKKIEAKTKTASKLPKENEIKLRTVPKRRAAMVRDSTTDSSDSSVPPPPKAKTKEVRKHRSKSATVLSCEIEGCHYSTTNSWSMKVHSQVKHSDDRPFKCDKCDMSFKVKGVLKTHQNIHDGTRYECPFEGCTVNYAYKKDIQKHIKILHTKVAPLLHCDWEGCKYSTYDKESLKIHRNVHTGERQFKCADCGQSFRSSSSLYNHRRVHDSERRFKCSLEGCEYSSYSKESLKVHQITHTDQRPYKCVWPECGQAFKSSSNLWSHKLMHENQRRYKCNWAGCSYSTNLSGHLKAHQNIHTGIKSHKCPECDQSFRSTTSLNKHKRTHENQSGYRCSFEGCDFVGNLRTGLQRHEQRVHGKKPKTKPKRPPSLTTTIVETTAHPTTDGNNLDLLHSQLKSDSTTILELQPVSSVLPVSTVEMIACQQMVPELGQQQQQQELPPPQNIHHSISLQLL